MSLETTPVIGPSSIIGKSKIVPIRKVSGNDSVNTEAWSVNEKKSEEENAPFITRENNNEKGKIFSIDVESNKKCDKIRSKPFEGSRKKSVRLKLIKICSCCPWSVPWMLLIISTVQICIFLLNNSVIHQTLIFSPINLNEVWRFITYIFLHAGAVHLFLNVIIQILVAFPLETEQGHFKVLFVYFMGALSGALGASVFEPMLMVGASAGVYCLLMSHIPHIIMNFSSLSHRYFRVVAVFVLCISDVIYSIRHCLAKGNSQPCIGVAAHISGAVSGLLIGFVVYKGSKLIYYRVIKYLALIIYIGWFVATLLYNFDKDVLDFL